MKWHAFICVTSLTLVPFSASPTTWGEPSSEADPIVHGAKCIVQEPASSGSYIYQWPSKYDQVFWPATDPNGIWFCRESGFTAFLGDFKLSAGEKAALSAHLPQVYTEKVRKRPPLRELLELLQQSYSKRETTREFQIRLLRTLAYYNDAEFQDYASSSRLRREALALIEEELQTALQEGQRLEYLFVSSAYYRELGEVPKSDERLHELQAAVNSVSDESLKGYAEYLSSLTDDLARIAPGGALAPEPVKE